ncbi:MAG TPA: DUF4177 domain-containing protein [Verrucomicrobiae bacterium]|jgi:uncharacterized lipoprotein YajG
MKTKIKYLLVLVLASFVFAGCCTMHKSAQWEYKTVALSSQGSDAELNSLGKDGWQLVSVTLESNDQRAFYYFKRPKH